MTPVADVESAVQAEPRAEAGEERGRRVALVTGATAGIGKAFAVRLAADGWDVVLVARDEERLAELAGSLTGTYNVRAEPLRADLSTDAGVVLVEKRLRDTRIDLLVNNAGLSLNTPFLKSTMDRELYLLSVNIQAVLRLTHAALPGMVSRRSGAIINLSSVSGFAATMPGSTYPASKAWVTNFSESIALSVARYGVRVMALCPGFTRSEFHSRAGIDMSKTPGWMWLSSSQVVSEALRDLEKGRTLSVPSRKYKILVGIMRHTPTRLLRRLARGARVRTGRDTE
jgi:short-subunit dehydrogenase